MDWINIIITIASLVIGFVLAQVGDQFKESKEKKRKLKKLLFNLLQLHHTLKSEYDFENGFDELMSKLILRIPEEKRENAKDELTFLLPQMKIVLRNSFANVNRIEYLEKNIDTIIEDFSEIFPIFAYELFEEYKIKEKLQNIEDYLTQMGKQINEVPPVEIKDWLTSKLTAKIIKNIENHIQSSALSINRKTKNAVTRKLNTSDQADERFEKFVDEYLNEFYKKYGIIE